MTGGWAVSDPLWAYERGQVDVPLAKDKDQEKADARRQAQVKKMEASQKGTAAKAPVVANGDVVEFLQAEGKVLAHGNVKIEYEGVVMTADSATVYVDTNDALAEGNVRVVQGTDVLRGHRISYNFDTKKGVIMQAEVSAAPWVAKGETAKKLSDTQIEIERASFTTCDYAEPHYYLKCKQVKIYLGQRVVARNTVLYIGKLPVLYLPYYAHPINDNRPRFSVSTGKEKDWGYYALTTYRQYFNQNLALILHSDYRENLGFAWGPDFEINFGAFGGGLLRTYYTQERNRNIAQSQPAEFERYRWLYRHKWAIAEDTRLYIDYYRASDATFNRDYFRRDHILLRDDPQTQVTLIKSTPNASLTLRTEKRTNRFLDATERLPELMVDISPTQIGETNFYYEGRNSATHFNQKTADANREDIAANRLDTFHKLTHQRRYWGWLNIAPNISARETLYDHGLRADGTRSDESPLRWSPGTGIEATTRIRRIFDIETNALGLDIHRLRHMIQPKVGYEYAPHPTVLPEKLPQFDSVDSVDRSNQFSLGLDNRLQTKRQDEEGLWSSVDLVDMQNSVAYQYKPEEGSGFREVSNILTIRPYSWFQAVSELFYDVPNHRVTEFTMDALVKRSSVEAGLGYRQVLDAEGLIHSDREVTGEVAWWISPKWAVRGYVRADFRDQNRSRTIKEREIAIRRVFHCITVELSFNQSDSAAVFIKAYLTAFPETESRLFKHTYSRPHVGNSVQGSEQVNRLGSLFSKQ